MANDIRQEEIDSFITKMIKENPRQVALWFLAQMGKDVFASNVSAITLSAIKNLKSKYLKHFNQ